MKFDTNKFALAAATTMTLSKIIKMFVWRPFMWCRPMFRGMVKWRYQYGFGAKHFPTTMKEAMPPVCPWYYPVAKIAMVFVATFIMAWFFAWLYNWMTCKK